MSRDIDSRDTGFEIIEPRDDRRYEDGRHEDARQQDARDQRSPDPQILHEQRLYKRIGDESLNLAKSIK